MDLYTVLLLVLVVVFLVLLIGVYKLSHRTKEKSLYDRLGGIFPITAVVNDFSDALINNPVVGKQSKNPFLSDWNNNHLDRLPGLKFMRTLWLSAVSGGPFTYTPVRRGRCPFSLENAHKALQISPEEFDAVAEELSNTLKKFNVPEKESSEVLAAFAAHKSEVTMGYNVAHHLPVPPVKC